MDALRFLRERGELFHLHPPHNRFLFFCFTHVSSQLSVIDLLETQRAPRSLAAETNMVKPCCETLLTGQNPHQEDHGWLDLKVIENLPVSFKKGEEDSWDWLVISRSGLQVKESF